MSREPFDESLLTAYLDDELTHDERARVESALRESPKLTKLLEELRIVRKLVTNAVRSEEGKLIGGEATPSMEAPQASFTIKGPWQSATVTRPSAPPVIEAPRAVDPENVTARQQAYPTALVGAMVLASLAATVLVGLFVVSPWRSEERFEVAAASSGRGYEEAIASVPANSRLSVEKSQAASSSNMESIGLSSEATDVPVSNHLGAASDALIQLLADASSLPKDAPARESSDASRPADAPRFVFVLSSQADSVPSADAKDAVAASSAEPTGSPSFTRAAPGIGIGGVGGAAAGGVGGGGVGGGFAGGSVAGGSVAGGRAESGAMDRSTGGAASGRGAAEPANAPAFVQETDARIEEHDPGLKQARKSKANEPNDGWWALDALDRPEPSQGLSSQLIIEFRFPKDRVDQAVLALRKLGIVLPEGILERDPSVQSFVSEIDDSRKAMYERIERRLVESDKADDVESESISVPSPTKSDIEPMQDQWRSIRILVRRTFTERE
ncbi:MAG: zf-HC2 domain-containing protein [Pirellula sp.]